MRSLRKPRVDVDNKDKNAPGATWIEIRRDERRGLAYWLRRSLPMALGAVAGAFGYNGIALVLGLMIGAIIGLTMVFIVYHIDIERASVAVVAGVVGAATGAPAATFLWIALLPSFAPTLLVGSIGGATIGLALLAAFFGWLVGTLAGGFAALVIWGIMEFFG